MEIKLSTYRKAVQNGCGALHQISRAAHKPGLSHLYGAIESMEIRCKRLEQTANSQLRAMVSVINNMNFSDLLLTILSDVCLLSRVRIMSGFVIGGALG